MHKTILAALAVLSLSACMVGGGGGGTPNTAATPIGPYESVRRAGDLIFLSGQIGSRADGTLAPGGIQAETTTALNKIRNLVESEGSSMDRVVSCVVYLVDFAEWDSMNVAYEKAFTTRKPARTAVGGLELPRGARVEISCIASVG